MQKNYIERFLNKKKKGCNSEDHPWKAAISKKKVVEEKINKKRVFLNEDQNERFNFE